MKLLSFLCTKWMENCEAMTSSTHSFAYSYRLVKKCFLKICETSKCHNFLIFQPIFIRFSLFSSKLFTLSFKIKLTLFRISSLKIWSAFYDGKIVIYRGNSSNSRCYSLRSVWVPFTDSLKRSYLFYCPHFPGTITAEWFWLCVRSQCHHISRMRTFDENSCAISITSPRSLSPLRTQHVWWDHREKFRRASTPWDCRGKSHLAGLPPANGTQSERGQTAVAQNINPSTFTCRSTVWIRLPRQNVPLSKDLLYSLLSISETT